MGKLIDKTGEIYGNYQIIEELGKNRVNCRCLKCGNVQEHWKSSITHYRAVCKKCTKPKTFIDRTGQVFENLMIVKELREQKVEVKCTLCNHQDVYSKRLVVAKQISCNKCGEPRKSIVESRLNYPILIVKELSKGKVIGRCPKCNSIDKYIKHRLENHTSKCKKCNSNNEHGKALINTTGKIYKDLKVIKELGLGFVDCQCINCGHIDMYRKRSVVAEQGSCTKCYPRTTNYKPRETGKYTEKTPKTNTGITGETYGKLKVLMDKGTGTVTCECMKCNSIEIYNKSTLDNNTKCKVCDNNNYKDEKSYSDKTHSKDNSEGYKGKIVNNLIILGLNHIDKKLIKYYRCTCNLCGENLVLTAGQIANHKCKRK